MLVARIKKDLCLAVHVLATNSPKMGLVLELFTWTLCNYMTGPVAAACRRFLFPASNYERCTSFCALSPLPFFIFADVCSRGHPYVFSVLL